MSIEQKVEGPKTVIAVVGDTGAGKSSLMNALLDHRSVLPTSGIRACTAVVVEVVQNNNSDMLEADIEFLQRRVLINSCHAECFYLTGLQIFGGPGSLSYYFKIWPITFQGSGPS